MTTRKRLEGALADWHPHPKDNNSLAPVVRDAAAAAADDLADPFFDSAPAVATPEPPIVAPEPAARLVAIDSAAVRARRRYLMRYVAGAVSVAAVIGLAAIVRTTLAGDASAADTPRAVAVAASLPASEPVTAPADPPAQPADTAAAQPTAPAQPADTAAAQAPAAAADPPAPPAAEAPAAVQPVDPAAASAAPPSAQSAAEAKKASLKALERGHLADAIEAGEQSVALDPGDADAWLVLGAAYQQRGHYAEARRCFTTCAAQAQRGPRRECRALAR